MKKHTLLPKEDIINLDFTHAPLVHTRRGNRVISYYDVPCAYDIETSSFRDSYDNKVSFAYCHAVNIGGFVFKMETWEQLQITFRYIAKKASLHPNYKRLIVYIHNLSYEFQFMKHYFDWVEVFNNGGTTSQMKALTSDGIEFRCSNMLSGYNLANTAKNILTYDIEKMSGDLDYNLIRTPNTPLSSEEEGYVLNDVLIIEYYLRELQALEGDITKIPLTKTGFVRNHTRRHTVEGQSKQAKEYRKLISTLTMEPDEYEALRRTFAGGFTHGNVMYSGKTIENVAAWDFGSSYPGRMVSMKFPMGKGEKVDIHNEDDLIENLNKYCCMFYVKLTGLVRTANAGYLSASKAVRSSHVTTNNGRVESADSFELWVTDMDFECIQMSYDADDYEVMELWRYKRGYLPTPFVKVITELFQKKTTLKGVKGKEAEYNRAKENLNSLYGMCVQDVVQPEFEWDNLSKSSHEVGRDLDETLERHNKNRKRFLFYPWGVWITAYSRYELFRSIVQLEGDYKYADTDSAYLTNEPKHLDMFQRENARIHRMLERAAKHHGMDVSEFSPVDPKGNTRTIGAWEHDGQYKLFKTLGAKRYMIMKESNGENIVDITVSGVNKSSAVPWMIQEFIIKTLTPDNTEKINIQVTGENKSAAVHYLLEEYGHLLFEAFSEGLEIPEGACGKSTHTYINEAHSGTVRDYTGAEYEYETLSYIHLEETTYRMSISDEYKELIEYLQEKAPN